MKKSFIFLLLVMAFCTFNFIDTKAESNYTTFQELNLSEGRMLKEFSDDELAPYYKPISKRIFAGWKTNYIQKEIKCNFISQTIFSYYNKGTTPVIYNYSVSQSTVNKFSISGSGSIDYSLSGTKSGFKHGLNTALKIDCSEKVETTTETKESLKIEVDPNTQATLYITGEGLLYNGVAIEYYFWCRLRKGGFEYFMLQTEYPRLEKVTI